MCSHSILRFRLRSAAAPTYSRKRAMIGAMAMFSIATFCRRTSSTSRSSGPSKSGSRTGGGREAALAGSAIGRLRPVEILFAVDASGGQKFGKLPHQVRRIVVDDLEAAGPARRGSSPGDGVGQILKARPAVLGRSGGGVKLTGCGFGPGRGELLDHV